MCLLLTIRDVPLKSIPGLLVLTVMLCLCPMGADAQPLPENLLENAIGDCIGKEGAIGDAVGDLTIDPKTGRVVYRCDSDPKGAEKVLEAGRGAKATGVGSPAAKAQAGSASSKATVQAGATPKGAASKGTAKGEAQKSVEDIPAADHGAASAYMNTPRGPAPDRPQDCVGAHPYYMTFPVCVMARKMGLLGDRTAASPTASAQGAPAAAPPPGPGPVPATQGAAVQGEASQGSTPQGTEAAPPTPQPGSSKRTIGPLPEDASEAAARAAEKVHGSAAGETATAEGGEAKDDKAVKARPMGSVSGSGVVDEGIDWIDILSWIGVGIGGLLALGGLVTGILVIVNRIRMKRMGDLDDPYLAYFDDPGDLHPVEEGDGPGLFDGMDDVEEPLGAFDEEPLEHGLMDPGPSGKGTAVGGRDRAFTS
ncbi:hypothetical protein [Rhodospirillum sp. A1_3_36]|uniref:hypothetical protein n=1 Tax=Rhodospirillum sp. A1_3_36 TaxID=3391666 RepID=UPI0039A652C3